MSEMARWTYVNKLQVKPKGEVDRWGDVVYGEPYSLMADYAADSELTTASTGEQFVSRHVIYCEDERPKVGDLIYIPLVDEWQEIKAITAWPMGAFGDPKPDFKLVT